MNTASNFEAEKENEDTPDNGEDESLQSVSGDDLLGTFGGNLLSHTDLAHQNVPREVISHLMGFRVQFCFEKINNSFYPGNWHL